MNNEDIKENQSVKEESVIQDLFDTKPIDESTPKQEPDENPQTDQVQAVIDTVSSSQNSQKNKKEEFSQIINQIIKVVKEKVGILKHKSAVVLKKAHANIQDKKAEKNEIKPDKVVLAPGEIKRYKLFFVSDMEEEAAYLHQMSLGGMHFVKKAGIQYVFRTGETKNYFYHLGYYEKDKRDGERYAANYADAGWENIYHEKGEFDGVWNYFRTEVDEESPEPHIFSDRISRIALYERLLSSWRTLLAMMVICLLLMGLFLFFLNSKIGRVDTIFLILSITISIVILLIFAIYSRIYLKINKKLAELKK